MLGDLAVAVVINNTADSYRIDMTFCFENELPLSTRTLVAEETVRLPSSV